MIRLLIFFVLLLSVTSLATQSPPALLPAPQRLVWTRESFILTGTVAIHPTVPAAGAVGESVAAFIRQISQAAVYVGKPSGTQPVIVLRIDSGGVLSKRPEGYTLTITRRRITLTGASETGLFRAYQTLRQLLQPGPVRFAGCHITDYPAFPVRGFMHDTGRSFIPFDTLKQHIDQLSAYKINVFHWHLTEDLAWRLQSDSLPNLTNPAVTLRDPGLFYTKQQARELVSFCKARHVLLIPELDMPGHSAAFERATGHNMQSPEGKVLVKKLIREACALFDVPYLHLGTDEVAFKDPAFVGEMVAEVQQCGKQVIGWYPGAAMAPGIIRQLWVRNNKPLPPMPVIESRNLYVNHAATQADLIGIFQRNLCDTTEGSPTRLGAIGCVWNDRKPADLTQIETLNGFYPLMLTLAERAWRGGGQPETGQGVVLTDKAAFAAFENRLLAHKKQYFRGLSFPYVRQQSLHWRLLNPFPNNGRLDTVFPPETGQLDFPGIDVTGATIYLRHTWGPQVVRAWLDAPQPNHTAYAYTYVYSPGEQQAGAWIDFHNYGRSEKDASPMAGTWDYKGSRIWVNDAEIRPPQWTQPGLHPSGMEQPYRDEPYELRPPVSITLHKGWNKLLVKLPVGAFSTKDYRLVKWLFTCVFVRQDPASGHWVTAGELIFSPDKTFSKP
nr:beta-N-acetylhexosaminidase [uncultured Arsenicibacter sp.]